MIKQTTTIPYSLTPTGIPIYQHTLTPPLKTKSSKKPTKSSQKRNKRNGNNNNISSPIQNDYVIPPTPSPHFASLPLIPFEEQEHNDSFEEYEYSPPRFDVPFFEVKVEWRENELISPQQMKKLRLQLCTQNVSNHELKLEIKYLQKKLKRFTKEANSNPTPQQQRPPAQRERGSVSSVEKRKSLLSNNKDKQNSDLNTTLFGVSLEEVLQRESEQYHTIPSIVLQMINFLSQENVLKAEGIFRLSGSYELKEDLKGRIERGENVDFFSVSKSDPHTVAMLFKQYLRELPYPLLTPTQHHYNQLLATYNQHQQNGIFQGKGISEMKAFILHLPKPNRAILFRLFSLLLKLLEYSQFNKMSASSLAILFSNNLIRATGDQLSRPSTPLSRSTTPSGSSKRSSTPTSPFKGNFSFLNLDSNTANEILKDEMQNANAINSLTTMLINNAHTLFIEDANYDTFKAVVNENEGETTNSKNAGALKWGYGMAFHGPKFSIESEESKLEGVYPHPYHTYFKQHRHQYAQLIRALQHQVSWVPKLGLSISSPTEMHQLSKIIVDTIFDRISVDFTVFRDMLVSLVKGWSAFPVRNNANTLPITISHTSLVQSSSTASSMKLGGMLVFSAPNAFSEKEKSSPHSSVNLTTSLPLHQPPIISKCVPPLFLSYVLGRVARSMTGYLRNLLRPYLLNVVGNSSIELCPPQSQLPKEKNSKNEKQNEPKFDKYALESVASGLLECLLSEDAISTMPSDLVFVFQLLNKYGEDVNINLEQIETSDTDSEKGDELKNIEYGVAFGKWFLFSMFILPAIQNPVSYDILDPLVGDVVTEKGLENLKFVSKVIYYVVGIPSLFPSYGSSTSNKYLNTTNQNIINEINSDLVDESFVTRYRLSLDIFYRRIFSIDLEAELNAYNPSLPTTHIYKPIEMTRVISTSLYDLYIIHSLLLTHIYAPTPQNKTNNNPNNINNNNSKNNNNNKNINNSNSNSDNNNNEEEHRELDTISLLLSDMRDPPLLKEEDEVLVLLQGNIETNIANFETENDDEKNETENSVDVIDEDLVQTWDLLAEHHLLSTHPESFLHRKRIEELEDFLVTKISVIDQLQHDYQQVIQGINLLHEYNDELMNTKWSLYMKIQVLFLDWIAKRQPSQLFLGESREKSVSVLTLHHSNYYNHKHNNSNHHNHNKSNNNNNNNNSTFSKNTTKTPLRSKSNLAFSDITKPISPHILSSPNPLAALLSSEDFYSNTPT